LRGTATTPAPAADGAPVLVRRAPARRRGWSLRNPELRTVLLVGDTLAVAGAAWLAPDVWAAFDPNYAPGATVPYWQLSSIVLWVAALRVATGDDPSAPRLSWRSLASVGQALVIMTTLVLALFYVAPFFAPRGSTLIALPIVAAVVAVWRVVYARLLGTSVFDLHVAIVGTDDGARRAARALLESKGSPYRVQAFVAPVQDATSILGLPVISVQDDLWSVVQALGVEQLVIGNTQSLPPTMLNELVRCFDHGVEAVPATTIYEEISGRVLASALEADWYAELPTRTRGLYMGVKRLTDIVLGGALLVVTLPLMAIVAALIFADSGRPILLRQVRLGMRGEPFVMHKFRTMNRDAEPEGRAIWASANDERITRVGRFLRRSRLDELPQLWDVVRGAMSLIGPRPERPEFVERLATELPLFRARTLVRPGLSGWAQVEYRYAGSIADNLSKLEYDLFYLRHLGPLIDLTIAIRTFFIIVRLRGQ
jgi:exopolysaccharide biosynthesis polyprenyl glycosylphosphotransferase